MTLRASSLLMDGTFGFPWESTGVKGLLAIWYLGAWKKVDLSGFVWNWRRNLHHLSHNL